MNTSTQENNDLIGFGIDIGGSGIKGARVDLRTGEFIGDRIKIATPQPATPEAVANTVAEIINIAQWEGPIGITIPAVVRDGVALTAANIDPSWVGTNLSELFAGVLGDREVSVLNDADAAGLAEVRFGDERAGNGVVILLTFGTGIGSAVFIDGTLVPNTELGHMIIDGQEAEHVASSRVKEVEDLSHKQWAKRVSRVLKEYEKLFWPALFLAGGGISRKAEKWMPHLKIDTEIAPAQLRNRAGIVGAAMAVHEHIQP